MSNPICRLLEKVPPGTKVIELMMNGEDVSRVDTFMGYDKKTGLALFTNESNSTFVAIASRIDMIEFAPIDEVYKD